MNKSVTLIGVIMFVLGLIAQVYLVTTTHTGLFGFTSTDTSTPFQQFSFPLLIGGLVLIIIGLFLPKNASLQS